MKYSQLINFKPIEDTIQLLTANDATKAREYVQSYVVSDSMAANLRAPVIDQLQMDEVVDNKGVLIVGNYGTGKSHLMSVLSAVAQDADNLQYVKNTKFADVLQPIAGKFEVLRIEIGGVTMPLRELLFGFIQDDLNARGITYQTPDLSSVRDNKQLIRDMVLSFNEKYPDKGYLIVIDEFLSYLSSRNERDIVLDLEFFRALGEMCSKSKLRIVCGVQEKIFDNPKFSFVSDTLRHVSDRFTQIIITKEDTAYVVSERILKKTPEQKAMIRAHLEKFCNLYTGMSSKLDTFVELYPIHPAYIDVFNKLAVIENRHILKNISLAIKNIFNTDVPQDAPGIISFDDYWPAIKSNGLLRADVTISQVVNASEQLEDILNRSFPKPAYKALAIQIIYALSVHRLTTSGLDVQFGMTAENLKDDLCLHLPMPEQDADFLLGIVNATLRDIMSTVSGQFIICNEANNQYYIDVNKVVDYDEKVRQKASLLAEDELNRYFYTVVYSCMEWDKRQYVTGFNIYEHDLNWESHKVFREGYLFMGLPGERSTAQPERDFYMHIMPPYGSANAQTGDLDDEVYFYFKSDEAFKDIMSLYAAACSLAEISEGRDKDAYLRKADVMRKKLIRYLSDNKNTCFDVSYKRTRKQLIEVLGRDYDRDATFGATLDMAASKCLDAYFNSVYPDFPVMRTKITRANMRENAKAAYDHFAGRTTAQSRLMLQSFGLLDGDKIRPAGSKYAAYYVDMLKRLPPQGVLNYSDLFEERGMWKVDKKFRIWDIFTPIILLALVHAGYAVLTLRNGETITASSLDRVPRLAVTDLNEFKYLSRPSELPLAELKRLFDILGLNPAELDNPNDREGAVYKLVEVAKEKCNAAVLIEQRVQNGFALWGESLVDEATQRKMRLACGTVKNEFANYGTRFNTPAKLHNFNLSMEQVDALGSSLALLQKIETLTAFRQACADAVRYVEQIEMYSLHDALQEQIAQAKAIFREARGSVLQGADGNAAAQKVCRSLDAVKNAYIDFYFDYHKKKRFGIEDAQRRARIQESAAFGNLRKLRGIEILSGAKFAQIEQDLAGLKVCYELTPTELQAQPICPHCRLTPDDTAPNVHGQLENIESRIESLTAEWTRMLSDTINDPLVLQQKQYLTAQQAQVIDAFLSDSVLPERVDDFFVGSIKAMLQNYEPVVISADTLLHQLEQLPPMSEADFKVKLNAIVAEYTRGKDPETLRIVVKRKEET